MAEFERDPIRERTQAGLDLARKRGKRFGRPPATDAGQRARILRLQKSGHSLLIATRVGVGCDRNRTQRKSFSGADVKLRPQPRLKLDEDQRSL